MNLSTPFSVNIISQMRSKQWRRPEEELGSSLKEVIYADAAAGSYGEFSLCDCDVCWVMLME